MSVTIRERESGTRAGRRRMSGRAWPSTKATGISTRRPFRPTSCA